MRILCLVPGSGGSFYCQNCLRDYAMVRALRQHGHDAVIVPLYLPMFDGPTGVPTDTPIFFGGINAYLRERFPIFRKAPRWLERLFDARWMLWRAAAREGSTNAAELGAMTLSMLDGFGGNQKTEYERFVAWLATEVRPDIIHMSNALLLGFAPVIQDALGVPLICSLQDEAPWVDSMRAPYDRLCWDAMARHGSRVAAFVATSRWYADLMIERMRISRERIAVVYPGIDASNLGHAELSFSPPTVGFLAKIDEAQGFGALVDAFVQLRREPALKNLELSATGGVMPANHAFIAAIQAKLRAAGAEDAMHIDREFRTAPRPEFFDALSVLSVPVQGGEAFGMQLVEAMARGIPVVQPRVGAYPELLESGGGVLYDPTDEGALADALRTVLANPEKAREIGRQGRAIVLERFNMDRVVRDMLAIYESVLGGAAS